MRFIVTGGLGYIGAHTVIQLYQAGHTAIILDDCRNSNESTIEALNKITQSFITFYKVDISKRDELFSAIKNEKADYIIHFAALKNVGESVQKPLEYYDNNLTGLLNILALAREINCPNFIFSSSCTVYPHFATKPLTEQVRAEASNMEYETIVTGFSPYGTSKLMCEQILHDLAKSDSFWNIIILRYFNPVGNHPSNFIGDDFKTKGRSLNLFTAILHNKVNDQSVRIFGNSYPTPDGTAIRDYIHVLDVADAHIEAANWSYSKKGLEIFNIGTGNGYSVLEIVKKFNQFGFDIKYEYVEARKGDIAEVYADCSKARNILKWSPKYLLDDMVEDTISYYIDNK
jgi:UDP-glucose 4-epimerase